jgi:hypothetical protein
MLLLLTQMVFFVEIHMFLQLSFIGLFEQNKSFPILTNMIGRKYSFQKLTQFLQEDNVLDTAASYVDYFLCQRTCVFLPQLKTPIFSIKAYLHLETPELQKEFLSNTNLILTGKECARCSCFFHRWFSFERYMSIFTLGVKSYLEKLSLCILWKFWFARSIPFKN